MNRLDQPSLDNTVRTLIYSENIATTDLYSLFGGISFHRKTDGVGIIYDGLLKSSFSEGTVKFFISKLLQEGIHLGLAATHQHFFAPETHINQWNIGLAFHILRARWSASIIADHLIPPTQPTFHSGLLVQSILRWEVSKTYQVQADFFFSTIRPLRWLLSSRYDWNQNWGFCLTLESTPLLSMGFIYTIKEKKHNFAVGSKYHSLLGASPWVSIHSTFPLPTRP